MLALLKEHGGQLGGETSGHIIDLSRTTTGDGLVTALSVLAVMQSTGRSLSELTSAMPQFPQILINVRADGRPDLAAAPVRASVARWSSVWANAGASCCERRAPSRWSG